VNLEDLARLRQGSYRLTRDGFGFPDPGMANRAASSIPVLSDLGLFDFAFSLSLVDYVETLSSSDPDTLMPAYMALFEVGVAGAACPAIESAWLADPDTGVATIQSELRRTYLRFGLPASLIEDAAVDHVTTELDVMAALCGIEAEMRATDRPVQRTVRNQIEFLHGHLGRWLPQMTEALIRVDRHEAYSALAVAANSLITHDQELLALFDQLESAEM
jgi:TorA maturation chaperone TorD